MPLLRTLFEALLDSTLGEEEVREQIPETSLEDLVALICCVAVNAFNKKTVRGELDSAFGLAKAKIDRRERVSHPRVSPDPREPEHEMTQNALDHAVLSSLARLGLNTAPSQKKTKQRCEVCGEPKSRCICVSPPATTKRHIPPPPPTPPTTKITKTTKTTKTDEDDHKNEGNEDTSTEEEDDTTTEEEENDNVFDDDNEDSNAKQTKLSLEKASVLLEPKKWRQAAIDHGVLELVRAIRFFYRGVSLTKPFDEAFLGDILSHLVRAMVATTAAEPLSHLCDAGSRLVARFEFFQDEKIHGAAAAAAAEAELCNRSVPKEIAKARRLSEKRAAQQKPNQQTQRQQGTNQSRNNRGGRGGDRGVRGGERGARGRAGGAPPAPTSG